MKQKLHGGGGRLKVKVQQTLYGGAFLQQARFANLPQIQFHD